MTALLVDSEASLRHELVGPPDALVILALGGISSTRHVVSSALDPSPGWWEGVAGPGCALDTATRRLLSVDFADGGRRRDGRPARVVTTHDQAARIVDVLDALGIARLAAVIGASYGGMVALALAEHWPDRLEQLVVICAAHEPHPMSVGLRALQRRIVELGLDTGRAADAMAIGRAVAMTTYRTASEFAERFDVEPAWNDGVAEFDVERYLINAGEKFAARVAPGRYLALSLSTDLHKVLPEGVRVPTTVVPAQGDTLVPPSQMRAMAKRLPNLLGVHLLRSRTGHDSFLTEPRRLGAILSATLAG
ncbi:MAG: homoserine O-succinyltransferase [Gemmatimonadota bacterium]|nr:homoserine O-succinyltransferase [Gemmatimonadota bacterium]